jgi:uncharacterized protein (DUF2147 family)
LPDPCRFPKRLADFEIGEPVQGLARRGRRRRPDSAPFNREWSIIMFKHIILVTAGLVAGQALAAPASPLVGVWVEVNGPGMARIAPCSAAPDRLCVTGLSRKAGGVTVEIGLVMTDIRATGSNRWRGTYLDGKRTLPATLRIVGERRVELKVCLLFLCQTASYERS